MTARRIATSTLLLCLGASCGGGGDGGADGSGFTAKVDGQAWEAAAVSIAARPVPGVAGSLIILGTQTAGTAQKSINLTLYNVRGPGTYALGVNSEVVGGEAQYSEAGVVWRTPDDGVAGTLTLTSLGGGRIIGTFAFATEPGKNNTMTVRPNITEGKFDVPFMGTLTPPADNKGSKVTAMLNGTPYNASTISTTKKGVAGVGFSTLTSLHGLSIDMADVTAPGTYALKNNMPQRTIGAGRNNSSNCCWGTPAGMEMGTFIVTSLTATRVQGTFTATLQPQSGKPATTALMVTEGTFDVGIE